MNPTQACPSQDSLEKLLRCPSSARDPSLESIEQHVLECEPCAAKLDAFASTGDLVGLVRKCSVSAAPTPDPVVDRLVQVLCRKQQELVGMSTNAEEDTKSFASEESADVVGPPPLPQAHAEPLPSQLGGYRLLETLGQGGMGIVYLAEDRRLQRQIALKVMRPELVQKPTAKERFLREARTAASLEHDNIVAIHQVEEADGTIYLTMPLLKGMSLEDSLRREPPATERSRPNKLSVPQILRIAREIAQGLKAAHAIGLIHRDIKPANIWLDSNAGGRVKLLDFGLARQQEEPGLTRSGVILGTPSYMAPEQAQGKSVDARADLFSVGCVLYRLCTGELPFRGKDVYSTLTALAVENPRPVREVNPLIPQALSELIARLLEKDPEQRLASANDLLRAIRTIERQLPAHTDARASGTHREVSSPSQQKVSTEKPPCRPRTHWWIGGAALVLLALIPLVLLFGGTCYRFVTNQGILVIEINDPTVEVIVRQNGVVVRDRTAKREFELSAGNGVVEVFEKYGVRLSTKQFTLQRGGSTRVRIHLEQNPGKSPGQDTPPSEREVAEWALGVGGEVTVREAEEVRTLYEPDNLPGRDFHILRLILYRAGKQVQDKDLRRLSGLAHLRTLDLGLTGITGAGLNHLRDLPKLTALNLEQTKVDGAGAKALGALTSLRLLNLAGTPIIDEDLIWIGQLRNLEGLFLDDTAIGDDGLGHLSPLRNLRFLSLRLTKMTNKGLQSLRNLHKLESLHLEKVGSGRYGRDLVWLRNLPELRELHLTFGGGTTNALLELIKFPKLTVLDLSGNAITNEGLLVLSQCKSLERLHLWGTRITDEGLPHLSLFPSLREIDLRYTQVTGGGALDYKERPKRLRILTKNGTIGPSPGERVP